MKLFYQLIIVHLIFNSYVFWRGWKILPRNKVYRYPFAGLFLFELLIYLIGFIGGENLYPEPLRTIMVMAFSWCIFIFYMLVFLFMFDAAWLLWRKVIKRTKVTLGKGLKLRRGYYFGSVIFIIFFMGWGYYNYRTPVIVEKDIVIHKTAGDMKGLRIVVASDLHIGIVSDKEVLQRYIDMIMAQKADVIFLPGDIIDFDLAPLVNERMADDLNKLNAPYGVYACTGNHEYYADGGDKIGWLREKTNIVLLQDTVVKVADSFYVAGREDPRSPNPPLALARILKGTDKDLPVFVLNHRPDDLNEEVENGADAAFYGHTHDGQIFPVNYALKLWFELSYGYKHKKETHLFVSSGLGVGGPEYRIGTLSEIVVVNVSFSDN